MIVLYFNNDIHDLLMIFMGMWVIVNWWVWPVPDFHFRKLEAMRFSSVRAKAALAYSRYE